ncbi:PEP-CTERM system TPR-repeat protein PrsT [Salinimonas sp. HHU 13199]|uniref:PEP-CTERM system TPR-repeat protein PrsT n=1 Tax=Salinimonas profundi TaxID=2729140 RepID=A0ABR8LMS2_9ALTE|nr:XrtA/PEP-CTERM system TPR-repeat protein PrsT [Salinimonas profundi]MBD3586648.1 PEP-CTERM system TPR-repeat protein PrsT [Salinimonas profundi]
MKKTLSKKFLIAALPLAIMAGCAEQDTGKQLEQAQSALNNKNYQEALVTLKSAVQNSPDSAEARLLLAQTYFEMGDMENAVSAYDRAMDAGASTVKLTDNYVSATYAYADNAATLQAIEQLRQRDDFQRSDFVDIIEALVLGRQGDKSEAQAILAELDSANLAQREATLLTLVDHFVVNTQTANEEILQRAAAKSSDDWVTQSLIAEIQYGMGKTEVALENFRQLLEKKPAFLRLNFNIAESLIRLQQFEEAKPYINEILKRYPNQALANQLSAIVAMSEEDFETATRRIEKAQNAGLSSALTHYVAGMSHFKLKNYEQAIANLERIVNQVPANHPAKQMYVAAKLQTGASNDALEIFNRSPEMVEDNTELSVVTGMRLIQDGFSSGAKQILSQVDAENIQTEQQRQEVGLFKLIAGDETGMEMVRQSSQRILSQEAEGNTKQAKLILLTMTANEDGEEAARAQLQQWQEQEPDNIENYLIAAEFEKYQGNYDALDAIYDKIAQLDSGNSAARNHKAARALEQEQYDAAFSQFMAILSDSPNDEPALRGAFLSAQNSQNAEANVKKLVSEMTGNDDASQYTKMYTYVLTGDTRRAIDIGKNANFPMETKPKAEFLLARAFLQSNQYQKAEYRLNKLVENEMSTPAVYYMLGRTQALQGAHDTAIRTLKPLIEQDSNVSDRAILLTADIYLSKKQPQQAQATLEKLSDAQRQTAAARLIQGKVAIANGNAGNAIDGLRQAYETSPNNSTVQTLYRALKADGQHEAALSLLDSHLQNTDNAGDTRELYANELAKSNPQASIEQYRQIANDDKSNWRAMNNLAWLLNQEGQQDEAHRWIQQALKVKPNQSALLNTKKEIEAQM